MSTSEPELHAPGPLGKPNRLQAPFGTGRHLVIEREPSRTAVHTHRILLLEDRGSHTVVLGGLPLRTADDMDCLLSALLALAADVELGGLP